MIRNKYYTLAYRPPSDVLHEGLDVKEERKKEKKKETRPYFSLDYFATVHVPRMIEVLI